MLITQTALSDSSKRNTFKPYVSSSLKYDSNLLRLPENVTPQESVGKNSKSDFIKQVRAGIDIDWKLSRQQLLLKTNLNQNWFTTFDELNYLGYSVLGQWNWELGKYLNGALGYSNKKSLGSFNQINGLIKNLQTEEHYFAEGNYEIFTDWHVGAGFHRSDLTYSDTIRQFGDRREDSFDFGLHYRNLLNNMLGFKVTVTDGSYPKRNFSSNSQLDNAYLRTAYEVEGAWHYSIKTWIDAHVGYTEQDFDHLNTRNFSEVTSHANIYWQPSEKTGLLLGGWRNIAQAENLTSSFVLSRGVRLIPTWSVTPKIKLNMLLSYEKQDFLGDPGFVAGNTVTQQDQIAIFGLNFNYKPFANTEMTAVIKHEERDSNNPSRTYQSQFGGLNLKLVF